MTLLPRSLALAAASAVALTSLQASTPAVAAGSAMTDTYHQSDSGDTVKVTKGDKIKVVLKGNPSTGYEWKVNKKASNGVFKIVRMEERSQGEPGLPGGATKVIYILKATTSGAGEFKAKFYRPFGDMDVARRFSLNVKVS